MSDFNSDTGMAFGTKIQLVGKTLIRVCTERMSFCIKQALCDHTYNLTNTHEQSHISSQPTAHTHTNTHTHTHTRVHTFDPESYSVVVLLLLDPTPCSP